MRCKTNKARHLGRALRFDVFCFRICASRIELVAQSCAGDVNGGPDIESVIIGEEFSTGVGGPAKVVVQPFGSQEPVIPKHPFKSHTCHPTELISKGLIGDEALYLRRVLEFEFSINRSQALMGPANACGAVKEPVGQYQIAKPSAGGS